MNKIVIYLIIATGLAVFSSCGSMSWYLPNSAELLLADDDYNGALENIETHRAKKFSAYRYKNEISLLLDQGLLSHYVGDYPASSRYLQEAQRLMEEAFTKSLSDAFKRAASNDVYNVDYPGEDFEDIYINIFCALNYYQQGNMESALVEIRRLNEKLVYIYDEYERGAGERNTWSEARRSSAPNDYKKSALANYLGMLFWRGIGNTDSARIDAQRITEAYNEYPDIYKNPLPGELVMRGNVNDELAIPANMARLNFLSFTGLSPYKYQEGDVRFSRTGPFISLEFRPSAVNRIEIVFSDGRKMNLSLLESMSSVMTQMYISREFYRSMLGFLTDWSATGGQTVKESFSITGTNSTPPENHYKLYKHLDLRMGAFLPGSAWVGGINLSPGTYTFTVNYYSGNTLADSKQFKDYKVEAGKLNLVEDTFVKYNSVRSPLRFNESEEAEYFINLPNNPPAPGNLNVKFLRTSKDVYDREVDHFQITWSAVPGALWYFVYSCYSGSDGLSMSLVDRTRSTSYTDANYSALSGYRIVAVGREGISMPTPMAEIRR